VLGEPGRAAALGTYLQRNIFFGDDAQIRNLNPLTKAFDLHGPGAQTIIARLFPEAASLAVAEGLEQSVEGHPLYIARHKPIVEQRFTLIIPNELAADLWSKLSAGALTAGSLVYNVLRVRAGLPSVGRELSERFIPLEVGLWDEVSFGKGCYTGQEIIARMESRNRLAKTLVSIQLEDMVNAPADILAAGRPAGQLTSSVIAPDGELFALGVVKPELAHVGQHLEIGPDRRSAQVKALAGTQPQIADPS
jgi:folate-binding protein YgfZ